MHEHNEHQKKGVFVHHSHEAARGENLLKTSAKATLHCLTGCVIGEILGLAIGVHFMLGVWTTMTLSTILAFVTGFSLAVFPVMKAQNLTFVRAFHAIWLGEVISIGVMEIVMNSVDYAVGGMQAASLTSLIFYQGLALAIPAGYLAAWPVNHYLIKKEVKGSCCH